MTTQNRKTSQMLNTAMDGLSVLVEHENTALDNQLAGLRERLAIARRARTLGELLRNQIDLLPDTQARLRRDHRVRRALLEGLTSDLRNSMRRRPQGLQSGKRPA